jgi:cytochrome oxidase Cu insertion factor (SCO1/SenC/PrrC family)
VVGGGGAGGRGERKSEGAAAAGDAVPALVSPAGGGAVPAAVSPAGGGHVPLWRRTVPRLAALAIVATATPIVVLLAVRHPGASGDTSGSIVTPPAVSWPEGHRPAPAFTPHDQNGRPVSVGAFKGRPVIVTFVDPLCRNLCPLEAHLLNQVVGSMPPASRPVIIAVSVDRWADTRADLLQDERQWELVPEWHWAVGTPAQLKAVWKRYGVSVAVVTKHIAGTAIHYVTHTEAAFIVDSTGHERALFLWPFYQQDVERVLHQLS